MKEKTATVPYTETKDKFETPFVLKDHSQLLGLAWEPIKADLKELSFFLEDYLLKQSASKTAHKVIRHMFASGGKRVRPALYFLACDMVGYKGPHRIPLGAVSEYVHGASLLHDDVVDNSSLRRHQPTANALWGNEAAVLVGDLIYASSSRLMVSSQHLEIVDLYANAITRMSDGELLQLEAIGNIQLKEDAYFQILSGKTGVLVGSCCRSAGVLAGLSEDKKQALYDFGYNIGVAFQIVDDALEFCQDETSTGKPPLADLHEGKVTLPLIKARDALSQEEQSSFKIDLSSYEGMLKVLSFVEEKRGVDQALEHAKRLTDKALNTIKVNFEPSLERDYLTSLATLLLHRVA